ncbi:hypothetical protein Q8F55_007975 [Vanrija albida]|uniref:ferric-chelate reductase (NADPH) n=1 Tax=Vanrija albida TaxID=181172 RepID=A0ABR3PV30_9TREE
MAAATLVPAVLTLLLLSPPAAAHGAKGGVHDARGHYIPTQEERTAYQAQRIPWANQVKYGYFYLAFLGAVVVLGAAAHFVFSLRVRRAKVPGYKTVAAALRAVAYPRARPSFVDRLYTLPSLGPGVVSVAGALLATGLTFGNKWFYWAPYYGSSPLCLRSEWIAMATLPFVYVLGTKRNILTALTGVSHEKLQAYHQSSALLFLYMSLVHTFACVVNAARAQGFATAVREDIIYTSGFVALAPLFVLCLASLPVFRAAAYELFYYVHIVMALMFIAALFWHGYGLLDNDAYCITAIVLFLGAAAWRGTMMLLNNPVLHRARVARLPDSTIRITIPTATVRWGAGQHVFLRFVGLRTAESHPFTIANAYPHTEGLTKDMVFVLRPQAGFTAALASAARTEYPVLVDGPYGHAADELAAFDTVLLCAGGSGLSWALAAAQAILRAERRPALKLVWAAREYAALQWFRDELAGLVADGADVEIFITGEAASPPEKGGKGDDGESEASGPTATHHGARPAFPAIIEQHVADAVGSVAVGACGPAGLIADCANAVAQAQVDIVRGRLPQVDEVYLSSEAYAW